MASSVDGSPQGVFRLWLRVLTGCGFAARFSGALDRLLYSEFLGEMDAGMADNVAAVLDASAMAHMVAVLLFPDVRDDDEIAGLIRLLAADPRWEARADPAFSRDAQEVGIELVWTTATGEKTHAMGFAPSGYMPVTRRAPFVALAAWTGGHENPLRAGAVAGVVTMGDAPPPDAAEPEKYAATLQRTRQDTGRLLAAPEVAPKTLRRLAFRLPKRVVEDRLMRSRRGGPDHDTV